VKIIDTSKFRSVDEIASIQDETQILEELKHPNVIELKVRRCDLKPVLKATVKWKPVLKATDAFSSHSVKPIEIRNCHLRLTI